MRFSDITPGADPPLRREVDRDVCANVMWAAILPGGMV
jgi:hypothetical protein